MNLSEAHPSQTLHAGAFSDAYAKGFALTTQFLRSHGIDPERAEEIAQAAWAKGWEKRRMLREPDRLIPWVNSIALNLFRGWFRRSRRDDELPETLSVEPLKNDVRFDLEKGLRACTGRERALLRERYIEGYSSLEVAERRRMNPVTVRVQLMRAKTKVRELLEGRRPRGGAMSAAHAAA